MTTQVPIKTKIPVEKHPQYAPFCQALTGEIKAIEYFEREKQLKLPVMVRILCSVSALKATLLSKTQHLLSFTLAVHLFSMLAHCSKANIHFLCFSAALSHKIGTIDVSQGPRLHRQS